MSQTWAILKDAYRELHARKMFWISIAIAVLVVSVFAIFGMNDKGIQILWFTLETDMLNTSVFARETLYKFLFAVIGLSLWLGWASTILALVSTASVIPDFAASGAIENMLARPISRTRLFLTKYAASLLFVILQTFVFAFLSVMVIGLRSGEWLWSLLYAVPTVTVFYSYLYCVAALVGVWTRSTLASLVAALALWGVVFAVSFVHLLVLQAKLSAEDPLPLERTNLVALRKQVAELPLDFPSPAESGEARRLREQLERKEAALVEREESAAKWNKWYRTTYLAHTILPKCGETKDMMMKWSDPKGDVRRFVESMGKNDSNNGFKGPSRRVQKQMEQVLGEENTVWYVLGTSLAFEAIVLGWACILFARRDF
jgi:ABC-type transport system involved in multi-copper enzyme maturation permease subunit